MKNRTIVYIAGFLFSFSLALTSYINSSFLENYIGKNYIGIIYVIASILTIWSMLKLPKILKSFGNRLTTIIFSTLTFLSLIILSTSNNNMTILGAFILYFISTNFVLASLDIFIEDFSAGAGIGKLRGLYLMVINGAWIVAQLISGLIIEKSSFKGIYLLATFETCIVSFIFVLSLKDFKDPKYTKVPVLKTMQVFIKNKNISKIYLINLLLKFFFAWMVIYTPIYLHEYLNFAWDKIGIIFTIMLIPFVLLDYPLGKMSDKMGEKRLLLWGFFISGIATLLIPLIDNLKLIIWATILFMTRVGAATIEVMSESYFFKEINEKNADEIGFFRNTQPVSYVIAPLLATLILFLVPSFKYLFFILGAIMLYGFYITLKLKDVK